MRTGYLTREAFETFAPERLLETVELEGITCGFVQAFRSEEVRQETWRDFATAQRAGITGFPTLVAGVGDGAEYTLVTQGYEPADRLIPLLVSWLQATSQSVGQKLT